MVTICLQDYRWEQIPVPVALTIRAAQWLYVDMAAIDCSCSFQESSVLPALQTYSKLPPGLLECSGGELLGDEWPAPPKQISGQYGGQWNKECQILWRPLCMMYLWPDRRETSGSVLWHPLRVFVHFSEDPAALSGPLCSAKKSGRVTIIKKLVQHWHIQLYPAVQEYGLI